MATDNPHHDTLTGILSNCDGALFVSQPEPLPAVKLYFSDDAIWEGLLTLSENLEPQTVHLRGTRNYAHFIVEEIL